MTTSRFRSLALSLSFVLVAAACGSGDSDASTDAADPQQVDQLSFSATTLGGGEFDASSLEGTDTVLWFWAPWCTLCRAEAPDVVETAASFEGSVNVIGVAGRGDVAEMEQFLDDTGTGGLEHIVDEDGTIWSGFEVAAQPAFAFIDDSGNVEVTLGSLGGEALTEKMEALAAA